MLGEGSVAACPSRWVKDSNDIDQLQLGVDGGDPG